MVGQQQNYCSECGSPVKIGENYCAFCGVKLNEVSPIEHFAKASSELPIKGWEVTSEKISKHEKLINEFPIGNYIITSRCKLDKHFGYIVVSDNGFAWRIKEGFRTASWNYGKKKWVRWYDVYSITPKKLGEIEIVVKLRKNGALQLDNNGNYKTKKWKLAIYKNTRENSEDWNKRLESFNEIILEIYNRNKVDTDPHVSDSVI